MTIYTKVKGFSSFHLVTCEIIPTGNGYERLAIHSAEPISARSYYKQPAAVRFILGFSPASAPAWALHSVGQSQLFNRLHSL